MCKKTFNSWDELTDILLKQDKSKTFRFGFSLIAKNDHENNTIPLLGQDSCPSSPLLGGRGNLSRYEPKVFLNLSCFSIAF